MDVIYQQEQYLISLLTEPQLILGYVKGFKQPVALIQIKIASFSEVQMAHLQQALHYYFPGYEIDLTPQATAIEFAHCFAELMGLLQRKSGHPIFEKIEIECAKFDVFNLCIPMLNTICLQQTFAFVFQFVNNFTLATSFKPLEAVVKQRDALLHFLNVCAPYGSNSFRFLEAAHKANIPWFFIGVNAFQFGYARNSKWFDSSITGNTSYIAVKMSKDKWHASTFLKRMGIPTPEMHMVSMEQEAIQMAHKIGYPVAIKPDNQDGGDGVSANINSEQILRKAFHLANKFSKNLIIEKHIIGKDYRLVVLNGTLIWAIERVPAGVFGDGVNSIKALVDIVNQNPSRTRELFPVKKLDFNEEAIDLLKENTCTPDTIPEKGQFIALSRIANISRGGTAVAVFDKVHPDNKTLVETVAKLYRLDLAGIDLILPDIQVSYKEGGGKIIEVNSQPQLGASTAPHIYNQILTSLIENKGRIPIIVVMGHYANEEFIDHLEQVYFSEHKHIGVAKNKTSFISKQKVCEGASQYEVGRALLSLEEVEAIIFCVDELNDLDNGLPFDRFDLLFCLAAPLQTKKTQFREEDFMETLFTACLGQVFITETVVDDLQRFASFIPSNSILILDNQPSKAADTKKYPEFIQQVTYFDEILTLPVSNTPFSTLIKSLLHSSQVMTTNEEVIPA